MNKTVSTLDVKPLAGSCQHKWQNQESPYILAQVCALCRLFRYKPALTADWEYRAPIPVGQLPPEEPKQACEALPDPLPPP
jgi:hypothetical protein